jgi:hypothetical protein
MTTTGGCHCGQSCEAEGHAITHALCHTVGAMPERRWLAGRCTGWTLSSSRPKRELRATGPTKAARTGRSYVLFCSFEHYFYYPTTGPSRVGPLQVISRDRDRSLLLSTFPVRKRAVLDFD